MKIAIVANTAWYVANFRLTLMQALRDAGHEVVAVSPPGEGVARIQAQGFAHHAFALSGGGTNPWREARSVLALRRQLRATGAELVLSYTPKGNVYASFARWGSPCRQIANVSGLGSSFIAGNWLTALVTRLYRIAFRSIDRVFFQNEDDRQVFLRARLVDAAVTLRVPGSGVDLARFEAAPLPLGQAGRPVFLMIARLLGDKGVREYAAAARLLRQAVPGAVCQLLGDAASDNPTAVRPEELAAWVAAGDVQYLGYRDDVRPFIAASSCVVLPSYREGMPRTMLEAGAMSRPLIASDVPGCRDTLDDGVNGFLCAVRDPRSLADAMARMARLPEPALIEMGRQSRQKMVREFSEQVVIDRYLQAVEALQAGRGRPVVHQTF